MEALRFIFDIVFGHFDLFGSSCGDLVFSVSSLTVTECFLLNRYSFDQAASSYVHEKHRKVYK